MKTSLKLETPEESDKHDSEDGDNAGLDQTKSAGTLLEQSCIVKHIGGKVTIPPYREKTCEFCFLEKDPGVPRPSLLFSHVL